MWRDVDIDLESQDGLALLSERGRKKFGVQRLALRAFGLLSLGALVAALAFAVRLEDLALSSAKTEAERRLQAEALARAQVAQERRRFLVEVAKMALRREGQTPETRDSIAENLDRLFQVEGQAIESAKTLPEIEGDAEALTVYQGPISGKTFALNATKGGGLDPEAVAAFLREDRDLSRLMTLASQRAQQASQARPEVILDRDIARIRREVEEQP